jgi:hypothetical protein
VVADEGGIVVNCEWWDVVGKVAGCWCNLEEKREEVGQWWIEIGKGGRVGCGKLLLRGKWHLFRWAEHGGQAVPKGDVDTSPPLLFWNGGHL